MPKIYDGKPERDMEFVKIPAGSFLMGSDKAYDPEAAEHECVEGKPHEQGITYDYWIGRYPVTVAQFKCFVEDMAGYRNDRWWSEAGRSWRADRKAPENFVQQSRWLNRPVVYICWFEAMAYCAWLDKKLRGNHLLEWVTEENRASHCIQLPNEPEWERAARFGHKREAPWRYPWGEVGWKLDRANDNGEVGAVSAVGAFPAGVTPIGLHASKWKLPLNYGNCNVNS